jgi:hypothetical protein
LPAVDALIRGLKDENAKICNYSAYTLEWIGDVRVLEFLVKASRKEKDPETKRSIVKAIERLSNK